MISALILAVAAFRAFRAFASHVDHCVDIQSRAASEVIRRTPAYLSDQGGHCDCHGHGGGHGSCGV